MSKTSSQPPERMTVAVPLGWAQSRPSCEGHVARPARSDSGLVKGGARVDAGAGGGPSGVPAAPRCDLPELPTRAPGPSALGFDFAGLQHMARGAWPSAAGAVSSQRSTFAGSPDDVLLSAIFEAEGDAPARGIPVEEIDVSEIVRDLASRIETLRDASARIDQGQTQTAAAIAELQTRLAAVDSAVAAILHMLAHDRDERRETRAQLARIEAGLDRMAVAPLDDFGPLEFVGGSRPSPADGADAAARPVAPDDEPLRLKDDPAWLDTAGFADVLGVTPQAVHQKRARGEIVGIPQGGRKVYFPLSQIGVAGGPLPGLTEVIALLDGDALEVDRTLRRSGPEFGQSTARDALIAGRREQVLTALHAMREGGFS